MAGVNKVIIIGRLGADPELKYTQNQTPVANLSVATSETWKDKQGQKQEKTEWHRVVLWNKLADLAGQYLNKGSQVYIEGKIQTRSWDDQNGQKRYTTEVVGNSMQFLSSKNDSMANSNQGQNMAPPADMPVPSSMGGGMEDDIPF